MIGVAELLDEKPFTEPAAVNVEEEEAEEMVGDDDEMGVDEVGVVCLVVV